MKQGNFPKPLEPSISPLDAIETFVAERRNYEKRAGITVKHATELNRILKILSRGCRDQGKFGTAWPSVSIYAKLDALIDSIISSSRKLHKKKWSRYLGVDRNWPKFKVRKIVEDFIHRVGCIPMRPYERLLSLVPHRKDSAELRKIITDLPKIRLGEKDPRSIQWEGLWQTLLFYRRSTSNSNLNHLETKISSIGNNKAIAYTVYLEIDQEDTQWVKRHLLGTPDAITWIASLQDQHLWNEIKGMAGTGNVLKLYDDCIINAPAESRRELNRIAQRRHREKKLQKNDDALA